MFEISFGIKKWRGEGRGKKGLSEVALWEWGGGYG